jgi:hypothetical protein
MSELLRWKNLCQKLTEGHHYYVLKENSADGIINWLGWGDEGLRMSIRSNSNSLHHRYKGDIEQAYLSMSFSIQKLSEYVLKFINRILKLIEEQKQERGIYRLHR